MKRWISYSLPLIGLAIFVYILWATDLAQVAAVIRGIDAHWLLLFPLITLTIILIRGLRWQWIMRHLGISYPLRRSACIWTIGFFASAITPGKLGDAVRSFYVKRETTSSLGEGFLTVFIDRLMDLIVILAFALVSLAVFSREYMRIPFHWALIIIALGILASLFLVMKRQWMGAVLKPLGRLLIPMALQERAALNFHSFYDSLGTYLRAWRRTGNVIAITLAYWLLVFTLVFTITSMMGLKISFAYVVLIVPIITIAEFLPIAISGLGTREAAVIYFFSVIGIDRAEALAFSLVYLVFGTYLTSLIGLVLWLRNPVSFE